MNYVNGKCPKCNRILLLDNDKDEWICKFCNEASPVQEYTSYYHSKTNSNTIPKAKFLFSDDYYVEKIAPKPKHSYSSDLSDLSKRILRKVDYLRNVSILQNYYYEDFIDFNSSFQMNCSSESYSRPGLFDKNVYGVYVSIPNSLYSTVKTLNEELSSYKIKIDGPYIIYNIERCNILGNHYNQVILGAKIYDGVSIAYNERKVKWYNPKKGDTITHTHLVAVKVSF